MRLIGGVCVLALAALLAGCSGPTPAYVELQNSIKKSIVKDDHRPVASVACNPHVKDVSYSDGIVQLTCFVRFSDGTSYSTGATIEARSFQVAGYNFEFDEPGPLDITTAPLPKPTTSTPATAGASLFFARNLRPVVKELAARFGSTHQLILSLALYPGELEAVIGANGEARLVTAHAARALTVGPQTPFEGSRSGIEISQLNPGVPQRLAERIAARAGMPMSSLDRFVLSSSGDLADWVIDARGGTVRYRAHIMGDALEQVTPGPPHKLK